MKRSDMDSNSFSFSDIDSLSIKRWVITVSAQRDIMKIKTNNALKILSIKIIFTASGT